MVPNVPVMDIPDLKLPVQVAAKADVGRLLRELELIGNALLQLNLRTGGAPVKLPKTSRLLEQTVELNRLDLLKPQDLQALGRFLANMYKTAPVLHISFSSDPSPLFTEKLTAWLRQEIHPRALLTIGLQPSIGAGCVVRGNSRYFDFSLKQSFRAKRGLLAARLTAGDKT